jgi:hypothetical protein
MRCRTGSFRLSVTRNSRSAAIARGRVNRVVAVEAAVEDDQHSFLDVVEEGLGQFPLPGADRPQLGGDDHVRAALAKPDHPHLRETRHPARSARPRGRTRPRSPRCLEHPT